MPYLIQCPSCAARLKSPQPVPAGRDVVCPQCKATFTLSAPAPEIGAAPAARSRNPDPAPRQRPADPVPAAEYADDDRARANTRRARDEEDDRPRFRKHREDDEEDDRPRARSRKPLDDDDDRPRGRKRPSDDEEDEPRARKRRDDDEEADDDRPRRGRKTKASKKLVLVAALGLAALFLLCAGAGVMYFVDPFGLFGGTSSEMLAWLPADTQAAEGADVEAIAKTGKTVTILRDELREAERVGLKADDISALVAGQGPAGVATEVTVFKLRGGADRAKVSAAGGGTEATANGKKYYKLRDGGGLYFASDRLVVLTRTEATLTGLLQKADGKVVISDDLRGAVKKGDGQAWRAAAGSKADLFGGKGGGIPGLAAPPAPKTSVVNTTFRGTEVEMRIDFEYTSADTAKTAAAAYESMFAMIKGIMGMGAGMVPGAPEAKKMQDAKKMFDSLKITQSGSTVTISMSGPLDGMDTFGKGGFGP